MENTSTATKALQPGELNEVRAMVEARTGFSVADQRAFAAAVAEHMRDCRLLFGADLLHQLRSSREDFQKLLDRILRRDGSFFRHPELFAALRDKVLPELHMQKFWEDPRRLRIWSAGCGAGEEAYSIAITVADILESFQDWDVRIYATDISQSALEHAQRGVYESRALLRLQPRQMEAYFAHVGSQFMVKPRIRNMVTFASANLNQSVYAGLFDCIFCMDVLTALVPERRASLLRSFSAGLRTGGYLFVNGVQPELLPPEFQTVEFQGAAFFQKTAAVRERAGTPEAM